MSCIQLITLARRLGMHVDYEVAPNYENYQWSGKKANWKKVNDSNRAHDIAHWALSPCSRRKLPGFGLGLEPEATKCMPDDQPLFSGANNEEEIASLLGIAIERLLDCYWMTTAEDHGWSTNMGEDLDEAWRQYGVHAFFPTSATTDFHPLSQARKLCNNIRRKYLTLRMLPNIEK